MERDALIAINRQLWHIEDFKRQCERENKFDKEFVDAARQVYLKNDLRALIKRGITMNYAAPLLWKKRAIVVRYLVSHKESNPKTPNPITVFRTGC